MANSDLKTLQQELSEILCGATLSGYCKACKLTFSQENVFTPAGWRETQLSGFCEKCFDNFFADEDR